MSGGTESWGISCAYCGGTKELTKDHLPPKNIFSKPRPEDLITVPACKSCHSRTSKDDEYFRLKLCLADGIGAHPDVRKTQAIIFRSLNRPQAPGLKQMVVNDTCVIDAQLEGEQIVGRLAFNLDLKRFYRVIERTVRGLYFHETGRSLPVDYLVAVRCDLTLSQESKETVAELRQDFILPLFDRPQRVIGNGVFAYRFDLLESNPLVSSWLLTFYGTKNFLALTGPKDPAE